MKRSVRSLAPFLALAATSALGCAHGLSGESVDAAFPDSFGLTQIIHVEQGENRLDFIASLRRQGDEYQLAMLDPAVQIPLYVAHTEGGKLVETKPLPPEAKDMGGMLIGSLSELFGARSFVRRPATDGTGDAFFFRNRRFEFEATPWSMEGECPFPAQIRMRTRGGPDLRVTAITEDVACGDQ